MNQSRDNFEPEKIFQFSTEFMQFKKADWSLIKASKPYLQHKIPVIVDDLYEKFMNHQGTAQFYQDANDQFDEESFRHRVEGFIHWFEKIFNSELQSNDFKKFIADVALIHTQELGFEEVEVPIIYMPPTFGFLYDRLVKILADELDDQQKLARISSAWQRFFQLQLSLMYGSAISG